MGIVFPISAVTFFRSAMAAASKTSAFRELKPQHQKHSLELIDTILYTKELYIARRFKGEVRGYIPLERLKSIAEYVKRGMDVEYLDVENLDLEYLHELDVEYLDLRKSLYQDALASAEEDKKDALQKEIEKPFQAIAQSLREKNKEALSTHKFSLASFSVFFAEESDFSEEECRILASYIKDHDWSKLLMPLYWTAAIYDDLLGYKIAFKVEEVTQFFFDLIAFHNLIEGSTLYGHHLNSLALVQPDTEAGRALLRLLQNGKADKMRSVERCGDGLEAALSQRCSLGRSADPYLQDLWLLNKMDTMAKLQDAEAIEDFVRVFRMLFKDNSITTLEDCSASASQKTPRKLCVDWDESKLVMSSGQKLLLTSEQFEEQSVIFKRCRAFMKAR